MAASSMGLARTPTIDPARSGSRVSSVLVIWLTTIAFVAFLVAVLGYSKLKLEQRVREQIATVAQLAADRAAMTFDLGDRLLSSVTDDISPADLRHSAATDIDRKASLTALLARQQTRTPGIVSLELVDATGTVLATASGSGIGERMGDQPYLRGLGNESANTTAFSEATTDPATGIRGVRMARRIMGSDGHVAGFVIAGIELEKSLVGFCQSMAFSDHDVIALRNTADRLLAGYPTDQDPFGDSEGVTIVSKAMAAGDFAGVRYLRSPVDGISRLVAYRKLPRYPLYMTYGKDVEDLLTMWRYQMAMAVVAAIFAFAVSSTVTAGIRRRNVLTAQLEIVRGHLVDSNNALRAALAASEMVAARDQLTGLWNRRAFDHRLQEAVAHTTRHDGVFSLLLLDLDHFKNINDQYGHVTGDEVLKRFADVLHERLRQNDVDARWGGEEFVVLADGAGLEAAFALAEHIRNAVENADFAGPARVTVSIGIAAYQQGETGDSLLARADDALYEAKRNGRNCVVAASGLAYGERFFTGTAAPVPLFAEDFT
jgi:diguanylate cyclase (GGDEF)-like protein